MNNQQSQSNRQFRTDALLIGAIVCAINIAIWLWKPGGPDRMQPGDTTIQRKSDSIQQAAHLAAGNAERYADSMNVIVVGLKQQINNVNSNTHESIRNIFHVTNTDSLQRFLSTQYDSLARTRFAGFITRQDSGSGVADHVRTRQRNQVSGFDYRHAR